MITVGEQRSKRRPGFQTQTPLLRSLVLAPGRIVQIIGAGKLRGGGKVGIDQPIASKPAAPVGQGVDIAQVMTQISPRRAHRVHVRRASL